MTRLLALVALVVAPMVSAQGLMWERVGDIAFGATKPSVAPDGRMWSTGSRGLLWMSPPYGPTDTWTVSQNEFGGQPLIALGQDTLVAQRNTGPRRSVDNGQTFTPAEFPDPGITDAFVEVPFGLPYGGTLIGELFNDFAIVSRDRGASWTRATLPNSAQESPSAYSLAVVRRGPHAGRIVGAGAWGLAVSDDGGASYTPVPGLWAYFRFNADAIAVLDRGAPAGGDRLVASYIDPQRPELAAFVLVSDDGGDSWRETFALTGDPNAAATDVVDFGGGRASIVMHGGHVWSTDDAGETWQIVGVVPGAMMDPAGSPMSGRVLWAVRGPDGRLYVGGSRLGGANPGWAFRTVAPVVAGEGGPDEAPEVGLSVSPNPTGERADIVVTLAEAQAVRVGVLDALGREIAVVLDGALAAGEQTLGVDTRSWPAGIYVVRVTASAGGGASGQVASVRLTVVR